MAHDEKRLTIMNTTWWIASALMFLAALLFLLGAKDSKSSERVKQRLDDLLQQENKFHTIDNKSFDFKHWQQSLLSTISGSDMEDWPRLLAQAGWGSERERYYFSIAAWIVPLICAISLVFLGLIFGYGPADLFVGLLFGFGLPFVGIRRFLRWKAKRRQAILRKEVVTWLHLLRMLFDAGLSLEQILKVTEQQGQDLIPNLSDELNQTLKRIEAGQGPGEALEDMVLPLELPELSDTIDMLKQVTRYGGKISDSLAEYAKLIEQRQSTDLREYVSKLSGKMTIVMMIFLFPALMILVAGPSILAMTNAFVGM